MTPAIFDQWSQSSKKVLFVYNRLIGRFDYLNQAFEPIWETGREQVLQSPESLLAYVGEQERETVALRFQTVSSGQSCEMEFSLQLPADRSKQVKVDAHPIVDAAGTITHIMGQAEDVTEQTRYRDYLLEFAQKKNNVLQIIVHDLRTPLGFMESATSLLAMDHAENNYEEFTTYTDLIHRAYEDCTQLIQEVLQDEHITSLGIPLKRKRFEAIGKVKQVADTFVKANLVEVPIHVKSPAESIMVELDEIKFGQILNNLITNSIKFTPPTGDITITLEQEGSALLITHTDTGIGIPKDLQPYLFEKHSSKAARPGLKGEQSNGVGLSIIKDLVEIQGGSIRFESEENEGTTFRITFPLLP